MCPNWQVFTGANGGNTTTLNSDSYGVAMNLTFGAVLEAYQVGVCNHYPPDQGIAFTNVTIRDANGANVAPGWTTDRHPVSPSCNANGTGTGATTNLTWCIPAAATLAVSRALVIVAKRLMMGAAARLGVRPVPPVQMGTRPAPTARASCAEHCVRSS